MLDTAQTDTAKNDAARGAEGPAAGPKKRGAKKKVKARAKKAKANKKVAKKARRKKAGGAKKKVAKAAGTEGQVPAKRGRRKKAAPKEQGTGRSAPRGKQGARLGAWVHVEKKDVFDYVARHRLTAAQLSNMVGVSQGLIGRWKAGDRFPSEVAQLKLAEILASAPAGASSRAPTNGALPAPVAISAGPFDGKGFRAWREGQNLSRKALAAQLGVSAGSIFGWESGKTEPQGENRRRLEGLLQAGAPGGGAKDRPGSRGTRAGASTASEAERVAAIEAAGRVLAARVAAGQTDSPEALLRLGRELRDALLG
ncbi:MAG: helix-turn-helix domain-containing protein [Planctomycetota bacterium]